MQASDEEKRNRILEATIRIFNREGLKFTMDDLAKELGMSKKTIYSVFSDKEMLLLAMADHCFDSIRTEKEKVLLRPDLSTAEKIRMLLSAMPETYLQIDLRQLYILRDRFPEVYRHVEERLDSDWEPAIGLLQKGMEEGVLRRFSIPVFRTMFQSTLSRFFQQDILVQCGLTYQEGLLEVIDLLMAGILSRGAVSDGV